jgi:DNA-binding CsgD family transcriptional regulator
MEAKCLRALLMYGSRGEVATALGIADSTVKTHLASARRKLGATSSFQAARRLAEAEAAPPNGPRPDRPIAAEANSPAGLPSRTVGTGAVDEVREDRASFQLSFPGAGTWAGSHDNAVGRRALVPIALAVIIAFLIALLVLAAPPFAERLGWLGDVLYNRN